MRHLFVERNYVTFRSIRGRTEACEKLPEFLRTPLIVEPYCLGTQYVDLEKVDLIESDDHLFSLNGSLKGAWSGYRSALIRDPKTDKLYKLKACSFVNQRDGNSTAEIVDGTLKGGQYLENAINEKESSDEINGVLVENGIEPVMNVLGIYVPEALVQGKELGITVTEVLGDTRLDELFYTIEMLYKGRTDIFGRDRNIEYILDNFYETLGIIVGSQKKLLDLNRLAWGGNETVTNAHIGNVVVYPSKKESEGLGVGFVDFDSTYRTCEQEAKERAKLEYRKFLGSIDIPEISMMLEAHSIIEERIRFRKRFKKGFIKGYKTKRDFYDTLNIGVELIGKLKTMLTSEVLV